MNKMQGFSDHSTEGRLRLKYLSHFYEFLTKSNPFNIFVAKISLYSSNLQ